jgi:hypothetical protein
MSVSIGLNKLPLKSMYHGTATDLIPMRSRSYKHKVRAVLDSNVCVELSLLCFRQTSCNDSHACIRSSELQWGYMCTLVATWRESMNDSSSTPTKVVPLAPISLHHSLCVVTLSTCASASSPAYTVQQQYTYSVCTVSKYNKQSAAAALWIRSVERTCVYTSVSSMWKALLRSRHNSQEALGRSKKHLSKVLMTCLTKLV